MMRIAVIGAGASGLAAALQAAWCGVNVTLFERNTMIGRKLLVTGGGRCNITNAAVTGAKYACADPAWMDTLLGQFGVEDLLSMLAGMAIPVHRTGDGWYYPLSDSAQSVVESFASALLLAGVTQCLDTQVTAIEPQGGGFTLQVNHAGQTQKDHFERVIVSAGGKAYPTLGSRGELFPVLTRLGHHVTAKRPALAPLLVDLGELKVLQGIRLDVGSSIWDGHQCLASAAGNLIFTQWGFNGPAVMDVSHVVSTRPNARLTLSLNLLAFIQTEFDDLLKRKRTIPLPLKIFLGAFFPPKVAALYVKLAHLPEDILLNQVQESALERLVGQLQNTRLVIKGVRDFEFCQVSAGGVSLADVDPLTLESRRVKGLFLTGETLDVVGPCGGYNLQYAFSSGALAGRAAAGPQL